MMEPKAAIQEFLLKYNGQELCIDCIPCTVVPHWTQGHHLLALVSSGASIEAEQGLFLFKYVDNILASADQLTVEALLPIKGDFRYSLSPALHSTRGDIQRATIVTSASRIEIDVNYDKRAANFFTNVKECLQANFEKIKRGVAPQFAWIQRYHNDQSTSLPTSHHLQGTTPNQINYRSQSQGSADPFGMGPFSGRSNFRQTVGAPDNLFPSRPAPPPPQRRSHSVHSPSAIQRDFVNPAALEGGFFDTYSSLDSPYATMDGSRRVSGGEASVEANQYANLAVTPPKNISRREERSEYIHPTPPKPQQVTTHHPLVQTSSSSSASSTSSSSSSSDDDGADKVDDAIKIEENFFDMSIDRPPPPIDKTAPLRPSKPPNYSHAKFYVDDDEYSEVNAFTGLFTPAGIREEVLKRRQDDYTYVEPFRLFVGTWNVNGQIPTQSLEEWLSTDSTAPDIYAIGFQELDLSKEAFLFNDSPREDEWKAAVENSLHPDGQYVLVRLIRLVGMMLLIYVRECHQRFIREVMAETVGTGIMGKMGNKGGVGVRMMFHNTTICFINSHLAAHLEEYERRNQDYHDICQRMTFEKGEGVEYRIRGHDFVVWMGDLNYRIGDMNIEDVMRRIQKRDFKVLLDNDQLNKQLQLDRVFMQYVEGKIGFKPTYKYDPGTDQYDTSEKQRIPAWCDRILYLGVIAKQLVYRSHNSLLLSDHKPVSSLFEVQVRVVDEAKYRAVVEEEIRKVDKKENEALPQLSISTNDIRIGEVHFMEKKKFTLDVANIGQVTTDYSFVNKLEDKHFCKPWIKVEPSRGYVEVGSFVEIKITIEVDKQTAGPLTSGEEKLEDILVLHLQNGKDYYITISGEYKPSCFGASIETLVRMLEPIGSIGVEAIQKMEKTDWSEESDTDISSQKFDVPKELWMLVNYLFKNGLKTEELFSKGAIHTDMLTVRDALDMCECDTMPASVYSIAEALLLFLESLREPVIPYEYYHKCLEASSNFVLCKQVLKRIPNSHRKVFKYLAAFIRELLLNSDDNKLDQKTLATLFGELFLRAPPDEREREAQLSSSNRRTLGQQRSRKKASFVYQFIIHEYDE